MCCVTSLQPRARTYQVRTYGCQMNVHDSERLAGLLQLLATVPFLRAVSTIPTVLMQARMEFRVFTLRTLVSTILGGGLPAEGSSERPLTTIAPSRFRSIR